MPGLSHLKDLYEKQGKDFVDSLLNKTVIVNEKMDGAYFGVKRDTEGGNLHFYKRNGEITYVDRVLSRYFEPAIKYFESLSPNVISKMPMPYLFGMEFFANHKPQSISYDRVPKNNLILSYIHILDNNGEVAKTVQEKAELDKWADLLGIERPPIIFQGKLSNEQKKEIQEFVYTPFDELVDKFKTASFTNYIMNVLNPEMKTTFLRDSKDKDIEGIVFRFSDDSNGSDDSVFLAKMVDPAFQESAKKRAGDARKKSDDYVWIIVIDLMNFIEQYTVSQLRNIKLTGDTYEKRYVSMVNHIFLEFMKDFAEKYRDLDIQIPDFLQRDDFNVNYGLIDNARVTSIIESNPNFKEIYRIFVNMFRKKKVRVSSTFFTKEMRDNLNAQIDKISKVIMGESIYENYFPTFGEFIGEGDDPGYFESFTDKKDRRTKPVNLIISDFQPIHPGHIKSAQKLFDENGLPTVFVCVHDGATSKVKPFKRDTVASGLSKIADMHPSFVAGYVIVPDGEVESLLKAIRPNYEPNIVAANKSRIRDLAMQIELARKRSRNLNLRRDLRLMELPFAGIKDTIMTAVKNGDYAGFKSAAPHAIHPEFFNMNRDITEKLNESISQEISREESEEPHSTDDERDIVVMEEVDLMDSNREEVKRKLEEVGVLNESLNPYAGFYKLDLERLQEMADALDDHQIAYLIDPEKNLITIESITGAAEAMIVKEHGGVFGYDETWSNGVIIRIQEAEVPPGAMM